MPDNWVTEWFDDTIRYEWDTQPWVQRADLRTCRRCGAVVEFAALPLHRKWHEGDPDDLSAPVAVPAGLPSAPGVSDA